MKVTNYIESHQDGGKLEQQLTALVQAAMNGDQNASQQIEQVMQAAQQGDHKAQKYAAFIQKIAEKLQQKSSQMSIAREGGKLSEEKSEVEVDKCGSKVKYLKALKGSKAKKKIQKDEFGKKISKPCPCQLRRVGGIIMEVDSCTGIPKHNIGGSVSTLKLQKGDEVKDPAADIVENGEQQWLFAPLRKEVYYAVGPDYVKRSALPSEGEPGYEQAKANEKMWKERSNKQPTNYLGLFASNGFKNLQSFAARKNWLLDPKNAEYVRTLGFDAKSYKGTAQQNLKLLSALQVQQLYNNDKN